MASLNKCSDTWSFIKCYLKAIGYFILFTSCLIFWPIAVLFIKYHSDGKYYLAKGGERAAREKKHEASEVLWSIGKKQYLKNILLVCYKYVLLIIGFWGSTGSNRLNFYEIII